MKEIGKFRTALARFCYRRPKTAVSLLVANLVLVIASGVFIIGYPSGHASVCGYVFAGLLFSTILFHLNLILGAMFSTSSLPEYKFDKVVKRARRKQKEFESTHSHFLFSPKLNDLIIDAEKTRDASRLEIWLVTYDKMLACKKKLEELNKAKNEISKAQTELCGLNQALQD